MMRNESPFADTLIGLAQAQLVFLRQANQTFSRPMRQAGVRWKGDRLLLNGCIVSGASIPFEIRGSSVFF